MQTLSQSTRAFITNAKGLKGFLVKFDLDKLDPSLLLHDAYKAGQLDSSQVYQIFSIEWVLFDLNK